MTPVGLLGGTFDPIHYGHLRLAEEMAEALGLDAVRVLPTGTPAHRGRPHAAAADRLAMVELAIAGNGRLRLDEHEVHKTEPCYMVDTLSELRGELGDELPIVLFLGADAFAGLEGWHQWRRLFALCHLAVAERPGYGLDGRLSPALAGVLASRQTSEPGALAGAPAGRVFRHAISQLDISASAIRTLVAAGRSPRYLLPDSVLSYIAQHRLYR
ncbi:nicotinate-nucleotide adenylyltransferase [Parasulfuritortus cantonensis]|uniref:Probable nicotinate-nucleotide adenylyltransferase n=1 Tax=Parasulfuritortus cantonensis TaxID=2528202 RepID=A0A4R1B775_9PROT|nr:nicotinate-nucleotide adenylyltransferase [Parasulfuritortus cantonensis]TCJ12757.1 nicotinate-nucleotide adenylyltransferase [Parasulfuritortus cantonensis]